MTTLAPGTPVRWQTIDEQTRVHYSPVHRASKKPGWTRCGKRIPPGAWSGKDVRVEWGSQCDGCLGADG